MKKRAKRRSFSWKKTGGIVTTLAAAISLFQQVERTAVTTARDVMSMVSERPVTYAEIEALQVHKAW